MEDADLLLGFLSGSDEEHATQSEATKENVLSGASVAQQPQPQPLQASAQDLPPTSQRSKAAHNYSHNRLNTAKPQQQGAKRRSDKMLSVIGKPNAKKCSAFENAFQQIGAAHNIGGNTLAQRKKDPFLDRYCNLRIANRRVPSLDMDEKMHGCRIVALKNVASTKEDFNGGSWCTFAVIVETEKKTSKKGTAFLKWTLTDLEGTSLNCMVFGKAVEGLKKESEGAVVCVAKPAILPKREHSDKVCLNIEYEEQVLSIGDAMDLSRCRSRRKDGQACSMWVNSSKTKHCQYHIKAAYRKVSNSRMDLQHGGSRNQLKGSRPLRQVAKQLPAMTKRTPAAGKLPSKQQKELAKALFEKGRPSSKRDNDAIDIPTYTRRSADLLPTPRLAKGMCNGEISLSPDPKRQRIHHSYQNALRTLNLRGKTLEKPNPNSSTTYSSEVALRLKLAQMSSTAASKVTNATRESSLEAVFGNMASSSSRAKSIRQQKSLNDHLAEQSDREQAVRHMNNLETKDQMAQQMQTVREMEVAAFECKECNYILQFRPKNCKDLGHRPTRFKTMKRFFRCDNCKRTDSVLKSIQCKQTCKGCGSNSWSRTSMYQGKELADRDRLKLTV